MSGTTEPRNALFPATQHLIAGQVAALKHARNSLYHGMDVHACKRVLAEQIAELEARLAVNAAAQSAVVPGYQGDFMPQATVVR